MFRCGGGYVNINMSTLVVVGGQVCCVVCNMFVRCS